MKASYNEWTAADWLTIAELHFHRGFENSSWLALLLWAELEAR